MKKQAPTITRTPAQMPGESEKAYMKRLMAFIRGDDVRTKVDLREWTGAPPFHLDDTRS